MFVLSTAFANKPVGAGLLANAVCQPTHVHLIHRFREQTCGSTAAPPVFCVDLNPAAHLSVNLAGMGAVQPSPAG